MNIHEGKGLEKQIRFDISCELSAGRQFSSNVKPYLSLSSSVLFGVVI